MTDFRDWMPGMGPASSGGRPAARHAGGPADHGGLHRDDDDPDRDVGSPAPTASADDEGPKGQRPLAALLSAVREIVTVVAIALGLSLLIKTFLVQAFFIPSESMENTLLIGDRVLVSKFTPGPFDLDRGDIIVFQDPGGWLDAPLAESQGLVRDGVRTMLTFVGLLPADSGDHLIKRVVGVAGDEVKCCDPQGRITINGQPVDEPYIYPGDKPSDDDFTVTVPSGRLWVMGDHRGLSQDSRYHRDTADGTVAVDDVVGRAFVTVWPFDRAGVLRTPSVAFAQVASGP